MGFNWLFLKQYMYFFCQMFVPVQAWYENIFHNSPKRYSQLRILVTDWYGFSVMCWPYIYWRQVLQPKWEIHKSESVWPSNVYKDKYAIFIPDAGSFECFVSPQFRAQEFLITCGGVWATKTGSVGGLSSVRRGCLGRDDFKSPAARLLAFVFR